MPEPQTVTQPVARRKNLRRRTGRTACEHEWVEEFDAAADAAAYNDGLNYSPAFEVCARCGKRRRLRDGSRLDWGCILWSPLILTFMLVIDLLVPFFLLAEAIYDALVSKRRS